MTDQSPEPYRKIAQVLAGVAVIGLSSAFGLAFFLSDDDFNFQTPAALAVNALGIIGFFSALGIGIIGVAAAIKRAEKSETVSNAVEAVKRGASELNRPKVTSTSGLSTADELAKWVALRDSGVVTDDEFQAARSELLKTKR